MRRALCMEQGLANKLERLAGKSTLRLTHRGRHSGRPYEVTIWFMVEGETIYLPTANLRRQWSRNVKANPQVSLKIGNETLSGTAEFITDRTERDHARALVKRKYWYTVPVLWSMQLLAAVGIIQDWSGYFRVRLETAPRTA
jgi:deazaflavin-dependent oxidoreductase (nitroreductase family)